MQVTAYEQQILDRGLAFRELVETKGWLILSSELEANATSLMKELVVSALDEDSLGSPNTRAIAAEISAIQRLLASVSDALDNYSKLSNKLIKES